MPYREGSGPPSAAPSLRCRLAVAAALLYAAVAAWLVFGPEPGDQADAVGRGVRAVGSVASGQRPSSSELSGGTVAFGLDAEEFSNVLLLFPLPVLAAFIWPRRRWWLAVPTGIALSGLIELFQLVVLDHRLPSWRDLGLNTTGVVAGGFAGWVVAASLTRSSRSS